MALRNVTRMLSQRLFSRGTRGIATSTGGGTETSKHITDENLRNLYARLKQDIAEVNQLTDEFHAYFALKEAFSRDRVIWSSFILSVGFNVVLQYQDILKYKKGIKELESQLPARPGDKQDAIKDMESQLSARHGENQELELPALAA